METGFCISEMKRLSHNLSDRQTFVTFVGVSVKHSLLMVRVALAKLMPSFTALGLGFYLSLLCEGHLRRHECLLIDNTETEFFGFIFQFLKIMFPSLI